MFRIYRQPLSGRGRCIRCLLLVKSDRQSANKALGLFTFSYERFLLFCYLQLTVRLTKEIVDSYQICNPSFEYSESCNPKRYLTVPSVGVSNNGSDNENHDLILYFGRILANDDNTRR